jgi:sec-independent protein translocase protein TatA
MLLFLNDIAGSEVLVILIFILIFFGSKSIPGIAKSLGQTMRQIRDASNELQHEIKKSGMDIKKDINLSSFVDDTVKEIQQPLDQYVEDIEHAVRYEAPKRSHLNQGSSEVNNDQPNTYQPDSDIKTAQDKPDLTQP